MSLKAFHLVFVTAITSLAVGCGAWRLTLGDWIFGGLALAVGVATVVYGVYFLKKLKNTSYL